MTSAPLRPLVLPTVAALCLFLTAGVARAQFQAGDLELRLSGFAQNDSNFDAVVANVGGQLGYFFSDEFEGGLRQDFSYSDADPSASDLSGATSLFLNYHFGGRGNALQPFIGGSVGYIYGDGINDTFVAGPEVGLKYFVHQTWFIFGQLEYQFFFDDAGDAGDAFDDGVFNYRLGLGVILG